MSPPTRDISLFAIFKTKGTVPAALQRSRASVLKYVRATRIKNTTDLCEALENNRHCVCQAVTGMSKNNSKRMRITITCDGNSPHGLQEEQVANYTQILGVCTLDIFPWVRWSSSDKATSSSWCGFIWNVLVEALMILELKFSADDSAGNTATVTHLKRQRQRQRNVARIFLSQSIPCRPLWIEFSCDS